MPKKRFPEDRPDFVGPRRPTLREQLAWAGVRPPSRVTSEATTRWRRRLVQMLAGR